jgi:hypothetical protein
MKVLKTNRTSKVSNGSNKKVGRREVSAANLLKNFA